MFKAGNLLIFKDSVSSYEQEMEQQEYFSTCTETRPLKVITIKKKDENLLKSESTNLENAESLALLQEI